VSRSVVSHGDDEVMGCLIRAPGTRWRNPFEKERRAEQDEPLKKGNQTKQG